MATYYGSFLAQDVKNLNKFAIIDLVRFTPGGISRVELARRVGLTRAAVTAIINDLLEAGIVREAETRDAPSGRKPVVLEINNSSGRVAGIDIGSTHVRLIIADFAAQVIAEAEQPLDIANGPELCLFEVDALLQRLLEEAGLTIEDIQAIGLGIPGPVLEESGTVGSHSILPGWYNYPIRDHAQTLWGCPVSIDNDSELGAMGEWAYGAGRGERHLVYLKIGAGIGAGLLLDNQIYRGVSGSAGQIGHMTIDENGAVCSCGNRGCLETMAGGRAIGYRAAEAVRTGQRTQLSSIKPPEKIVIRDVIAAARSGDLLAQHLISEAGGHVGTAVANIVNFFNPGLIVIGGGVAQIGDLLIDPIRQAVSQRSLKVASSAVRITTALLGPRSSAIGAVVQALSIALRQKAGGKEVRFRVGMDI
jgi:glucokinase-like ROK family protein